MKRSYQSLFLVLLAGALILSPGSGWVLAQAKAQKPPVQQPPEEQEEYTEEEYDAYDKAVNETDLDKKAEALIGFMDKFPKSKLQPHIVIAWQGLMYELQQKGAYAKLEKLSEQWMKFFPDDIQMLAYAAEAAQKLGHHKKYIDYALRIYAVKPSASLAFYITEGYEKLRDEAKHLEWTHKLFGYPEFDGDFNLRMTLVKKYGDRKDLAKAAEYSQMALKSLDAAKKPEAITPDEWNKNNTLVRRSCYLMIGMHRYDVDKFAEAIQAFEQALKVEKFDTPYYYIGLSQWRLGKVEEAILSFAKAELLKGETQKQANEHLVKLYKALHNNTTIGIEKAYNKAREQLGMPPLKI